MAAVAQDSSDISEDEESEWGWNAVKNWWNPSCNKGVKKAEKKLINAYIDDTKYEYESKQIPIDYDPEPISCKQRKLKRSKTFSFFSNSTTNDCNNCNNNTPSCHSQSHSLQFSSSVTAATMSTSAIPREDILANTKQQKSDNKEKLNTSNRNMTALNQQYIHTLTFRIKSDQLQSFMNENRNVSIENEDDIDSDEEFYHPPPPNNKLNEDDINNDGNAIEGKSMGKFYKRTVSQTGSSTYLELENELNSLSNNNDKQSIPNQKQIAPIVLLHGYGCGGGIYIPSISAIYDTLLSHINIEQSPEIHVLDLLGNGMSSRPEFQCETTKEAENFFVDSMEQWRKEMNIDKMILSGHSLGGYVCCVYAMKYPQNIEHLILISPVGLPVKPVDSGDNMKNYSWKVRTMFKTFSKLWNSGWTPHDVIRITGPKGKAVIQKLVQRRLFRLDDENPLKELLAEYLYHVVAQQGSGEYALNKILQPGAWAHNPLALRIGSLKQFQKNVKLYDMNDVDIDKEKEEDIDEEKKYDESDSNDIDVEDVLNCNMKISFIYGETDWMTSAHAVKLKQNNVIKCDVYINRECGHQLILENSKGFGELIGGVIAKGQLLS